MDAPRPIGYAPADRVPQCGAALVSPPLRERAFEGETVRCIVESPPPLTR